MKHMKHSKKFPGDPLIGKRAAAFVDSMPGRFYCTRAWAVGITLRELRKWRAGKMPRMRDVLKLGDKGADLNYILKGRRITE